MPGMPRPKRRNRAAVARRRLLKAALLCAALLYAPTAATADPLPALLSAPDERQSPGDPGWPLGARVENGVNVTVSAAPDPDRPGGTLFRVTVWPKPGAPAPAMRACAGLTSAIRRNLHKTRAVMLEIHASKPVAGLIVMTSSDTERPDRRDRSFGSFVIGTGWKTLRLVYGDLSPLPGWAAEAARQGHEPGDLVLRPDSTEDICIGAEAGRLPAGGATLFIRALRFAP